MPFRECADQEATELFQAMEGNLRDNGLKLDNAKFRLGRKLMVDAKTIRGCVYGATDPERDFPEMIRLHRARGLDLDALVTRRIELDDVNDAFRAMEAGEVARSVIVY